MCVHILHVTQLNIKKNINKYTVQSLTWIVFLILCNIVDNKCLDQIKSYHHCGVVMHFLSNLQNTNVELI